MAKPDSERLLPHAPAQPRGRNCRPAGAVRLVQTRCQTGPKVHVASPAERPRQLSETEDVAAENRQASPSASSGIGEDSSLLDEASDLNEDFLRCLCGGAKLEDVEALELRVDTARQSLESLGRCLPHLQRLRLSESSILCVRELGSHWSKLQVLWLGRCGLQDLDGLPLLEALRELYVPFNDVADVSWPKWLDNLEVLDLEANAVADLEDLAELAKCYALRDLTVRGNPATLLPSFCRRSFFQQLPKLEFLDDLPNFPELPAHVPPLPESEGPQPEFAEELPDRWGDRFLDSYLECDLNLYMDLYLHDENAEHLEDSLHPDDSWRRLFYPGELLPRLRDEERFAEEPSEEALILERLKAAPRGAKLPQPSLSVAPPPCTSRVPASSDGFRLKPPSRVAEGGSVLTRGGAMVGAPLTALRQRRGLYGAASEDSAAALLVDLDIRELLRRYS